MAIIWHLVLFLKKITCLVIKLNFNVMEYSPLKGHLNCTNLSTVLSAFQEAFYITAFNKISLNFCVLHSFHHGPRTIMMLKIMSL